MGSSWDYKTPFQTDIAAALDLLREQAFRNGDYYDLGSADRFRYEHEGFRLLPKERKQLRTRLESHGVQRVPRSITELLQQNGGAGAHSILDIAGLSDVPKAGAATPLSDIQLRRLFRTTQPTVDQVARAIEKIWDLCETDQAVYLTAFHNGQPIQLFFIGVSGH